MEKKGLFHEPEVFRLTAPPDELGELFLQAVLEDMDHPQPKRPLQCVTVKMPLPEYLRMKRAAQKWNMTYTDVINFCTQRVVPVLEAPSGKVAEKLEQRRLQAAARKALRHDRTRPAR